MNYKQCVKNKIFKKSGIYKNKKTGNEYKVLFTVINCTNAQDGQEMVAYIGGVKYLSGK